MIRELAERVKSHSFTEERGASEMVSILAMVGVVIALVGGVGIFASDFSDNNLQQQPDADITVEEAENGIQLIVRSQTNVDSLEMRVDGETGAEEISAYELNASVGDTAYVGDFTGNDDNGDDSTTDDDLEDGEIVTVVATDNPDTEATVLEYEH